MNMQNEKQSFMDSYISLPFSSGWIAFVRKKPIIKRGTKMLTNFLRLFSKNLTNLDFEDEPIN